jgi:uncharacterized membrane protein YebE (DUF533 family)
MFDAERLLGKVLHEVMGSSSSHKKKKHSSSLLGSLTSGAGLMTAIGLGIGAYEVLKEKKASAPPTSVPGYGSQPAPAAPAWGGAATMPPPPPPQPQAASQPSPPRAIPSASTGAVDSQELAIRMIRVMIAAAHADGTFDETEEKAILARLRTTDLSQEERMFILDELHQPKGLDELTSGITDPSIAKTMYMLAASTVAIDSPGERAWLDDLAARLSLSKAVQEFIEEQC